MAEGNRILVTGLALYSDVDPEGCQTCNYDFSWVFTHPSTFLWADKIIVSPTIMRNIENECVPGEDDMHEPVLGRVLRIVFEQAGEQGLLEMKEPAGFLDKRTLESIEKQADNDRRLLSDGFPEAVSLEGQEEVPGGFTIGAHHYCAPRIASFYVSFVLATMWNARMLLNSHTFTFLKYVLGLRAKRLVSTQNEVQAFTEVLRGHLPEIDVRPHIGPKSCWNCKHMDKCDESELLRIAKGIREYLRYREYDEVIQLKRAFSDVSKAAAGIPPQELTQHLVAEFRAREREIARQMQKVFPAIERWSAVGTIVSVPVVVAGITTQSPLIAGLGAGVAGMSQIAKHYLDVLKSKNRWVCFRQSDQLSGQPREISRPSEGVDGDEE